MDLHDIFRDHVGDHALFDVDARRRLAERMLVPQLGHNRDRMEPRILRQCKRNDLSTHNTQSRTRNTTHNLTQNTRTHEHIDSRSCGLDCAETSELQELCLRSSAAVTRRNALRTSSASAKARMQYDCTPVSDFDISARERLT